MAIHSLEQRRKSVSSVISALAEYYDKKLTETQIAMYVEDLGDLSLADLSEAVKRYRRDPKNSFFPLPAKLREIVESQDGRPMPDEAWAMIPKDEYGSVIWTDEMAEAFGEARKLLDEDRIAARTTFKEIYTKLVSDARSQRRRVRWTPSMGYDRAARSTALTEAVEKQRITLEEARGWGLEYKSQAIAIEGPTEPSQFVTPKLPFKEILKQLQDRHKRNG